jgi:hypothetical protein
MGVPSDQLMNMIKSQRDSATPAGVPPAPDMPTPGMSDASAPPMGAPMSTPEPKMGNREAAMINISMAMDLLEQSLPAIGSETAEGRQILSAIGQMTKILGPRKQKTAELQPAEILQMLQTLPQAGGASPEAKVMSQAPAIPGMSGQPSAAPPAPPPLPTGMPPGALPGATSVPTGAPGMPSPM